MPSEVKTMKFLFYREISIDSKFTFHNFLKKGPRTFSILTLKSKDESYSRALGIRDPESKTLLKLFKKLKFARKVDLGSLHLVKPSPSFSAFLCIAKRISYVKVLSIYDCRRKQVNYEGLFTTWPKYLKHLKSLCFQIKIEQTGGFLSQSTSKIPKMILFPTDFLRFLPRFEEIKIVFPFFEHLSQMDRICQFEKYPTSIRKISLYHPGVYNPTIGHLKRLKSLETVLISAASLKLMRTTGNLISQVPTQLQALSLNLRGEFAGDDSIYTEIRRLVNLKKVKLELSSGSLQILESLEECLLECLSLRVHIQAGQDISFVKDLILKKRKSLKRLKLLIMKEQGHFEIVVALEELIKVIDNLPGLINLSFWLLASKLESNLESSLTFTKLLSKSIPLKKFQLKSNQESFSKTAFSRLLSSLQEISPQIEKLQIDVGKFEPSDDTEINLVLDFIRSLVNIQVLKFPSLCIPSKGFDKLIEVIYTLRDLKTLYFGQVSDEIPKLLVIQGVERILVKYGLRNFSCQFSPEFRKSFQENLKGSYCINRMNVRKKNPYLMTFPNVPISSPDIEEEIW